MKQTAKKKEKMDMESMMETYKELAVPGPQHKMLARLAGSWTTRTRSSMEPGQPPVESTGTCEQKMILDGHYLQQEYAGDMMGNPFIGINTIGYDNYAKKFVSTWVDSMSTGIYFFEGKASADGKTVTQKCSFDDPVRGPMNWRSVMRVVDDNTIEYRMFMTPKGGVEKMEMEMTVTRK